MAPPGVNMGLRKGPFESCLDPELIKRFAAATRDPSPRACAGVAMPPIAMVTQVWDAQVCARDEIVNQEMRATAHGGAHAEHDIVLHRPPVPGERLRTWVEAWGSHPASRHAFATSYYTTFDDSGDLVVEQWWTNVYRETTCEAVGRPDPDHTFPEAAREHPVACYEIRLDQGLPRRYAEVSGDWAVIHFDDDAARRGGFERLATHGLSTLSLCSQGIVDRLAGGDPDRVRRLAARFAAPAYLDEDLVVQMYEAGPRTYAFEAECGGAISVRHGLVELRA
jgi:acyl dehydratase